MAHAQSNEAPAEPKAPQSFDMTAIDKTADPCTRLLSVRLRQLAEEQSHPAGPGEMGRVHRTAGEKLLAALQGVGSSRESQPNADTAGAEIRRLLRRLHGYPARRQKGHQRRSSPLWTPSMHCSDKKQLAALLGTLEIRDGDRRSLQFRRGPGPEGLHPADRASRPGRARASRIATTTWRKIRGSRRFARNTSPT